MDAGPYYLGTGTEYFEREAVKADFRHMVEAGQKTRQSRSSSAAAAWPAATAISTACSMSPRKCSPSSACTDAKVAVIGAELDPEIVIKEFRKGALRPTGMVLSSSEEALRESTIVGQMGIHPLMTALDSGAQYILAGRSCDIALFASDMIRRGIDAGLAYHVGHVLECGALACDPGSPSDCLVAEIYDDGTALFVAPNPDRRCTPYSIAAHSLYEESHPAAAVLSRGHPGDGEDRVLRQGRAHRQAFATAGSCAQAKPWPWSIKLEGSRRLGARKVSLIYIDPADLPKIPADVLVYGRNGVQATPVDGAQRELGIIIETTREDAGGRGSAGEPAHALPDPLRLCGPQGDRRQHRLSAVAQSRELPARRRELRRDRAERYARPGVLRELCDDQGRRDQADRRRIPRCARQCRATRSPTPTRPIRRSCCARSIATRQALATLHAAEIERISALAQAQGSFAASTSMRRTPMRGRSTTSCRTRT